jgi:outer membrane immunogenic protein
MKKLVLLSAVSLVAIVSGGAFAADLPSRKAPPPAYVPPPPPPPMWTGFYAGVNLGGGWTNNNINTLNPALLALVATNQVPCNGMWCAQQGQWPMWGNNVPVAPIVTTNGAIVLVPGAVSSNSGGVVGGGQIGYNYQFGANFLVGIEADIQGTSIGGFEKLPWFGTVRGRAGYLIMPTLLVYGTGGFAYGGVQGPFGNFSNTRTGWTAGGGVEWMFMPNWSAKVEYLFADLSSGGTTGPFGFFTFGTHDHPQFNVVRAGVNYHFNWGAPAPVVASY